MELNREHFHTIIFYNFQRQLSQQECLAELLYFGDEAPHQSTISRWYEEFKEIVDAVRKLIIEDRHVSLKISKTSIQKILHEELGKPARVNWCQKMLDRFNSGNSKNVYSMVSGEEKPTKMVATFVSKAHIATNPLNKQRTVLWIGIPPFLRKINPERRIMLHQDNASSHTTQKTRQYLTEENVELLDHPPYSPDLSPNDLFTFPKIKNRLRGQRFQSPKEAVDAFKNAYGAERCRQRSLWDQEWNSIGFSDESRFCLGMHDGRARVRRRRGERRNPQFFVERHVHHTVGVMVWGAIAYGSRSPLIFIRGNMNAQHPTFQQDNARPHVARVTIDFFQHNDVTLLPWPPRSPDLSPIEHVWDMMGRRLNLQRPPQTLEALREEFVVAWNEIPQEDIDHLIRSMPRRVGECVAHQGASTHY
ncbi:unnamed protein product [Acanthoscelides obtectus]|uniref:Tc1-like transposase DDE domain-containing protein n=1 Tax=Acanthoscelides obtectus TaxID=200917 RepID=A0A9P0JWX9_ACAOB|nr:unnamed protein product [Acanthoscelides obtectus]CAK1679227.1 Transposable element Tc1 transposase [Acanthoscelides obtectus]